MFIKAKKVANTKIINTIANAINQYLKESVSFDMIDVFSILMKMV
jgi:hypothetical protein